MSCACGSPQESVALKGSDHTKRTSLGVFMKTNLNPPFSNLSYQLFQGEDSVASALAPAMELSNMASSLEDWAEPPGDSAQARQVFYEYAATMKVDAVTLVEAVRANRREDAIKSFETLQKKCDSCHHFFRYGE